MAAITMLLTIFFRYEVWGGMLVTSNC